MYGALRYIIVFLFLVVAGCAGRPADPIAKYQVNDERLSCGHVQGELENNRKRMTELRQERQNRASHNMRYAVSNPLLMDLGDRVEREMEALYKRNIRLGEMLVEKKCDGSFRPNPE